MEKLTFTMREAAAALQISVRSLHKLVQEGKIPHVRPFGCGSGKPILFPVRELEAWLSERARHSQQAEAGQWQNG